MTNESQNSNCFIIVDDWIIYHKYELLYRAKVSFTNLQERKKVSKTTSTANTIQFKIEKIYLIQSGGGMKVQRVMVCAGYGRRLNRKPIEVVNERFR
jgi:hypothetical protein